MINDYEVTQLIAWLREPNRVQANVAFTAGPARELACHIEDAISEAVKDKLSEAI